MREVGLFKKKFFTNFPVRNVFIYFEHVAPNIQQRACNPYGQLAPLSKYQNEKSHRQIHLLGQSRSKIIRNLFLFRNKSYNLQKIDL